MTASTATGAWVAAALLAVHVALAALGSLGGGAFDLRGLAADPDRPTFYDDDWEEWLGRARSSLPADAVVLYVNAGRVQPNDQWRFFRTSWALYPRRVLWGAMRPRPFSHDWRIELGALDRAARARLLRERRVTALALEGVAPEELAGEGGAARVVLAGDARCLLVLERPGDGE